MLSVAEPGQQLDAIKAGLAVGGATGAALTVLLAARKQQHQEYIHLHDRRIAELNQQDAEEPRINEIYVSALNLLESEHATSRQGALASLGSIADEYPRWRSPIVQVLCSFLRRPLPDGVAVPAPENETPFDPAWPAACDERRTAIEILIRHLPDNPYLYPEIQYIQRQGYIRTPKDWGKHSWNLAGAVIPSLDLNGITLEGADFRGARFTGPITIRECEIRSANFTNTHLNDRIRFEESDMSGLEFQGAKIRDMSMSSRSVSISNFRNTEFTGDICVAHTALEMEIDFTGAKFKTTPSFAPVAVYGSGVKIPGWAVDWDSDPRPYKNRERTRRWPAPREEDSLPPPGTLKRSHI
ncbi:pentapeptide repeat-containing protein [Nocardiopsis potens]|uniref:pentapeptide repeat-containing protein n=1 Tax=Nocardiopsis potens TaxID=1246458 RepID=UPI0012685BC3|nr:pentapeptide repeat-containing protein [Nocardiopsis potens]